jgi:ABC-type dipeptide/oligopeptide/nickel transport system permease subunit
MTIADLETLGPGQPDEAPTEIVNKKIVGKSPTRIAFERLRKDKVAVACASIVAILVLLGVFAPVICKLWGILPDDAPNHGHNSDFITNGYPNVGPPFYGFTWEHPLGLAMGTAYDNLARLLYGLRTSLFIASVATLVSTIIGVTVGLVAGFARGAVDRVIGFFIDVFLSFPFILGALALAPIITGRFAENASALSKAQLFSLISVLIIFTWMYLARLIRGQVLSLREREFVMAAQVIGVPTRRILYKELLPNMVAPIVVSISLTLPAFVAAEAGLSFLGIGLTGIPSLGQTINKAQASFSLYPLYLWAPVITVMVLVVALNLLGDSVRDAFDPKTRR